MSKVSVLSDIVCHLGEGPTYDPLSQKLFWFDIRGRKLLEKPWPNGEVIVHDLPEMASALGVVDAGRQLLVTETGVYIRDVLSGVLTLHQAIEADNPATRSNDARVHPCGAFWIGTMGKDEAKGAGAIYWFFKGELRTLFTGITVPNSICFSPDGATAYFTGLDENVLMSVACDPSTGLAIGEPGIFCDTRGSSGWIDGSIVDADGTLWNARWDGAGLDAYSPDGKLLTHIDLPARRTSCPAFVGAGADRMVVTSAWQGLTGEERQADPHAGKTFLVDVAVKGRHEPRVVL